LESDSRKRKENFGHSRNLFNNHRNNIIFDLILDNYIPIKETKTERAASCKLLIEKQAHSPHVGMTGIHNISIKISSLRRGLG
jgi:hypothetical protein